MDNKKKILFKMFLVLLLIFQLLCLYLFLDKIFIPKVESSGLRIFGYVTFYYILIFVFLPFFLSFCYLSDLYKILIKETFKKNKFFLLFKLIICNVLIIYSLSYASCSLGCRYEGNYFFDTLGITYVFKQKKDVFDGQLFK